MERKERNKIIIRVIAFFIIGIFLFNLISTILLPDWIDNSDVSLTIRGLYEEPENSLDVIFVGNSNVYRGVSPMQLWKEKGIASYDYSSPIQKVWISYYFIKECFEYQKPKVIVLDVDELFNDEQAPEQSIRKALDNMRFGKNKWEAINDPIFGHTFFDKLSYLFPIIRYHSRWDKLVARDLKRPLLSYHSTFKGYLPTKQTKGYKQKVQYMKKADRPIPSETLGEKSIQYLEKIVTLCKENGTKLILMELPSLKTWSATKNEAMATYAREHDLTFLDLNTEEVGINWDTDTEDEGFHLNKNGACKVSNYLAKHLTDFYQLPDHRQEETYQRWNEDLKKYEEGNW